MKIYLQVSTISGRFIENARYEMSIPWVHSTHEISLTYSITNPALVTLLASKNRAGIIFDGDNTEGYTASIKCDIKSIKHLLDVQNKESHTTIIVVPVNGTAEQVLLHCIDPKLCSPNFIKAM
jgi:hypothetical protein